MTFPIASAELLVQAQTQPLATVRLTEMATPTIFVVLPINPTELPDSVKTDARQFRIVGEGQHSLPIGRGEKNYKLTGYLPGGPLSNLIHVHGWQPPQWIADIVRAWVESQAKLSYDVTSRAGTLSVAVYINSYEFVRYGWAGSLRYTLELIEWRGMIVRVDDQSGTGPGSPPPTAQPGQPSVDSSTSDTSTLDPPTPSTYTVMPGDTLSFIAKKFLGDASLYQQIFDANSDTLADGSPGLTDPNIIQVGQQLWIPGGTASTDTTVDSSTPAPWPTGGGTDISQNPGEPGFPANNGGTDIVQQTTPGFPF